MFPRSGAGSWRSPGTYNSDSAATLTGADRTLEPGPSIPGNEPIQMSQERSNPEQLVLAIVGDGRAGGALARAARGAGIDVRVGGRDDFAAACEGAEAVLLCVPDDEVDAAARRWPSTTRRPSSATSAAPRP